MRAAHMYQTVQEASVGAASEQVSKQRTERAGSMSDAAG
jgi:hypothetical protein